MEDPSCLLHMSHTQYFEVILCSQLVNYSHSLQPVLFPQTKHFNSVIGTLLTNSTGILTVSWANTLGALIVLSFLVHDKCLAAFADVDQKAFPGNTYLPHSLHLALKVIVISNQSVIITIFTQEGC
jgi:hypothetical protein